MSKNERNRASYMTYEEQKKMGDKPRTHENCREATGRARPGKTAQDHARKGIK